MGLVKADVSGEPPAELDALLLRIELPDRCYWPVSTVRNGYVAKVGLSFRGP